MQIYFILQRNLDELCHVKRTSSTSVFGINTELSVQLKNLDMVMVRASKVSS